MAADKLGESGLRSVITGASGEIGGAIARAFAKRGDDLVLLYCTNEDAVRRLADELAAKGETIDFSVLLEDIKKRDYNDSHRDFAPLTQTEDSVYIDTSDMTIDQVLAKVLSYIKE